MDTKMKKKYFRVLMMSVLSTIIMNGCISKGNNRPFPWFSKKATISQPDVTSQETKNAAKESNDIIQQEEKNNQQPENEFDKRINELTEKMNTLDKEVTKLNTELKNIKENDDVNKRVETLEKDFAQSKKVLQSAQIEFLSMIDEIRKIKETIKNIQDIGGEINYEKLQSQYMILEKKYKKLEDDYKLFENKYQTLNNKYTQWEKDLIKKNNILNDEINKVKSEYDLLVKTNEKLNKDLRKISQTSNELTQEQGELNKSEAIQQPISQDTETTIPSSLSAQRILVIKNSIYKQLDNLDKEIGTGNLTWRNAIIYNMAPTIKKLEDKDEKIYVHNLYKEHLKTRKDFSSWYAFEEHCTKLIK